ncbi:MAG: alpha/beta fold hydrolase [Deltaproteobacteria bacterium]|nr:alpha/beta fold hydrolase [Deltaproteobacteria bacterium]
MAPETLYPAFWARSPHVQTIFGSLRLRAIGKNEMTDASQQVITDAGPGVRLLGFHSRQHARAPRGLIILIHGWEGSSDSTYILSTGRFFFRLGYEIFRLNLRDHGQSHHLNPGLFHGALTDETAQAVANAARLLPDLPCYLIGFSLGGNFALRIALRQSDLAIPNLRRVFAISPALDPYRSTLAIDESFPIYRHYFLAKWKRSLRRKERCFPEIYRFDKILHHNSCMALTEAIMPWYTEFGSYRDYFDRYTLTGNVLASLAFPVTIITSADDPVVPVADFRHLPGNRHLDLDIQPYGGHCGFLDPFPFGCWYERRIGETIGQEEIR